jgi:putative oxidoreductase
MHSRTYNFLMQTFSQSFAVAFGRACLALVFLVSGAAKLFSWASVMGYMASRDIAWPGFFLCGAVLLEVGGGLSVLLGWKARTGAKALMLVLIPSTLAFHGFWHETEADFREQVLQFLKNLSILGGLILVAVHGSGPWSLDRGR